MSSHYFSIFRCKNNDIDFITSEATNYRSINYNKARINGNIGSSLFASLASLTSSAS
jgi:hypothetical protein